jgi:hypothetical protein
MCAGSIGKILRHFFGHLARPYGHGYPSISGELDLFDLRIDFLEIKGCRIKFSTAHSNISSGSG